MTSYQDNLTARARQLTRQFLGQYQQMKTESPDLAHNQDHVLSIVSTELIRLSMSCKNSEERQMIIEGFSQGLAQVRWNAENASRLVRQLEREILR
ncbi:hypothetical protein [Oceanospirillum sediminis]|uniref:Uncharacterized protein n=1 Tax=Oceanospirillum sediminis TaxID=2760088 RepID=A0A839IMW6_9GAMM|nr:hypothetical protein [Oceanospirillum sediminis]MBB1486298.1 hypothetical protein [Oceanospirillum sediminis]